jgi:MoxR-like ATPase
MKLLLSELNSGLFDKEESAALVFLASLSGESVFLLGPPGVAKSLIARRLAFLWRAAGVFEYLMNRFSTPDEIFGPVSIARLKNDDRYERNTAGYLPEADIVFLDEIWKAGPAIQNTLLTVLNEKRFKNGSEEITLPLKALIAASNGTPPPDEGLEALWDRFLVRVQVKPIQNDEYFLMMIDSYEDALCDTVADEHKITKSEYAAWNEAVNRIEMNEDARQALLFLKKRVDKEWYVSDRRWKKIVRLLRTAAFCNGRSTVTLIDIMLIRHCIWNEESTIDTAKRLVIETIQQHIIQKKDGGEHIIGTIRDELLQLISEVREATRTIEDSRVRNLTLVQGQYYAARRGEHIRYIKNADYVLLEDGERETALYRRQRLAQGYLRHNTHRQNAALNAFTMTLNECNIDLEAHFIFDRCAKTERTAGEDALIIDGERWKLDTEIHGDYRKTRRRAAKARERIWDKKCAWYTGWIHRAKDIYAAFIKHESSVHSRHLFIGKDDLNALFTLIRETENELDVLELQIDEIKHSYTNIKEDSVIFNAPSAV